MLWNMLAQYLACRMRITNSLCYLSKACHETWKKGNDWDIAFPIPSPEAKGCWQFHAALPTASLELRAHRHSPNSSPALPPAHSLAQQRHYMVHFCIYSNNSESVSHSFVACAHHLPQGTKKRMVTTELLCWLTGHWEVQVSEQNYLWAPKASSKATTGIYWLVKSDCNALPNKWEQMDVLYKTQQAREKKPKHWCTEYLGLCL